MREFPGLDAGPFCSKTATAYLTVTTRLLLLLPYCYSYPNTATVLFFVRYPTATDLMVKNTRPLRYPGSPLKMKRNNANVGARLKIFGI